MTVGNTRRGLPGARSAWSSDGQSVRVGIGVSHCVCPVDSSKARIRKAGDSREVLYRGHVLFYIVYAVRHAQLGVLPRSIFRGHHNLAVAFCHMGNCGHPGSELFCDAQHGSGVFADPEPCERHHTPA
jgi:hypothetical protein